MDRSVNLVCEWSTGSPPRLDLSEFDIWLHDVLTRSVGNDVAQRRQRTIRQGVFEASCLGLDLNHELSALCPSTPT